MLKVLHADKARVALGFSSQPSEKEVEDAHIAEEFCSLLNHERGKGAHVAACDSAEAISLAMAVQSLTSPAPVAAEKAFKAKECNSEEGDEEAFPVTEEGVDGSPDRLSIAPKERGETQQSSNPGDNNEAAPSDSETEEYLPEGNVGTSADKDPTEIEEWSKEASAEVGELVGSSASGEDEEAPIAITTPSEALPGQVAVRQAPTESGASDKALTAHRMVVSSAQEQSEVVAESTGSEESSSGVETARIVETKSIEAKPAIEVSIQPQAIKDAEITPFIADSAASILKRSNEVSAQMMMLRQAFESVRGGQGRESAAGIHGLGASSGGSSGMGSGVFGGAFKGANAESQLVREKAQPPLSKAATYRMLERVNATLKEAARARDGKTISLHLEPVDLGKIKVDVSLKDGALHARLTPESAQVVQALREHAHELQAALRRLGLDVEKVTVNVSADHQEKEFTPEQQNLGDGKGFQGNRNNMPQDSAQVAENTFGNELALGREGLEAAAEEAKTARVPSWRDNWVA